MIKEMAASQAAKALALCVCPVVGTGAVVMSVPKAREAVHRMTAPSKPKRARIARRTPAAPPATACPETPTTIVSGPLGPIDTLRGLSIPDVGDLSPTPLQALRSAGAGPTGSFVRGVPQVTNTPGVPEPQMWLQAIFGLGITGSVVRRVMRKREAAKA